MLYCCVEICLYANACVCLNVCTTKCQRIVQNLDKLRDECVLIRQIVCDLILSVWSDQFQCTLHTHKVYNNTMQCNDNRSSSREWNGEEMLMCQMWNDKELKMYLFALKGNAHYPLHCRGCIEQKEEERYEWKSKKFYWDVIWSNECYAVWAAHILFGNNNPTTAFQLYRKNKNSLSFKTSATPHTHKHKHIKPVDRMA